ncbi:Uncharacterised protein [Enterobacter hormaechei]|nr:Uncharacterised protein [Enterobacter hormaechei]
MYRYRCLIDTPFMCCHRDDGRNAVIRTAQTGAKYIPHMVDLFNGVAHPLLYTSTHFHIRMGKASCFFCITDCLRRNANQIGGLTHTPATGNFPGFRAIIVKLCNRDSFRHFMTGRNALVKRFHQSHSLFLIIIFALIY